MSEGRYATCHYCGGLFPVPFRRSPDGHRPVVQWEHAETHDDGSEIVTLAIYCGEGCAACSATTRYFTRLAR
jgi:hypothetical protein